MLSVYLAAPYAWKDKLQAYRKELTDASIVCTSRWLDEPHKPTTQIGDLPDGEFTKYAAQDFQDVVSADVLVFFTDPTKTIVRGGRHVEFGIALASGLPVFVIGEKENIFHYLPYVTHYENWKQVKNALQQMS